MKTVLVICIAFLLVLLLQACSPAYVSNSINYATFERNGDVSISFSTGKHLFEPQLAISPFTNIAVFANGVITDSRWSNELDDEEKNFNHFSYCFYSFPAIFAYNTHIHILK